MTQKSLNSCQAFQAVAYNTVIQFCCATVFDTSHNDILRAQKSGAPKVSQRSLDMTLLVGFTRILIFHGKSHWHLSNFKLLKSQLMILWPNSFF